MSDHIPSAFDVLAPLSNFNWDGDEFSVGNMCTIQRASPDLSLWKYYLSDFDQAFHFPVSHWISFKQSPNDGLSEAEKINTFLLALWLTIPTKTQVRFHLEIHGDFSEQYMKYRITRCHDQFQWVREQVKGVVETEHLEEASSYIPKIERVYTNRKRLRNSLALTYRGCTTIDWQTAFICFSAAAEAILTYSTGPGITKRLAKSYACLTQSTKNERDDAFRAFSRMYGVRSDIMHGRSYDRSNKESNRAELARFSDLLREMWKCVLGSREIIDELEKDDAAKESWFTKIERGYKPPLTK